MPSARILLFGAVLVGVVWGAGWLAGCNDDPVGPRKPGPQDYAIYFYEPQFNDSNWYFNYHPVSSALDSFFLHVSGVPSISAHGDKMYVRKSSALATTLVLSTDSFALIDEIPIWGICGESPDGQYLYMSGGDGFRILDATTYSELFSSPRLLAGPRFSSNSRRLYGYVLTDTLFFIDLSDSTYVTSFHVFPEYWVRGVVPNHDESVWYLYLRDHVTRDFSFAVYDVLADSMVSSDPLREGFGEIEVDPNGRYVYYSDPGDILGRAGPPWIYVYDAATNAKTDSISTEGVFSAPYDVGVPVHELYITPNSRWMGAADAGFRYFIAVDLHSHTVVHSRMTAGWWGITGVTGQNGH